MNALSADNKIFGPVSKRMVAFVWAVRLTVGAVFVMSGLVKAIDLWGTVFKFEEYFAVWGWSMPLSLTVMGAMMLCSAEFILGAMLFLGNYRRTVVWFLLLVMAVMLPLTLYIWLKDPVSDCGCFGDFIVMGNGVTFLKNLVITAALLWLVKFNKRVRGLFNPYSQWICGVACLVYVTVIELYGFNIQPMIDFRSFPAGTSLLEKPDDSADDIEFVFTYEKDGVRKSFTVDSLPDSTWTFVDRETSGKEDVEPSRTELSVFDSDGENVTADIISPSGPELLVVIPQHERADLFYTSYINDLNGLMNAMGGSLVELTDQSADSLGVLRDNSFAEFPVYSAESTVLKELSRGMVSIVMLENGVIQWKRNLGSVDVESIIDSPNPIDALNELNADGSKLLGRLSLLLAVFLMALAVVDKLLTVLIGGRKKRNVENNSLPLHNQTAQGPVDKIPTEK